MFQSSLKMGKKKQLAQKGHSQREIKERKIEKRAFIFFPRRRNLTMFAQ